MKSRCTMWILEIIIMSSSRQKATVHAVTSAELLLVYIKHAIYKLPIRNADKNGVYKDSFLNYKNNKTNISYNIYNF